MKFYYPSFFENLFLSVNATYEFIKKFVLSNNISKNIKEKNCKYAIKRRATDGMYMKDYKAPSFKDVDLDGIKDTPVAPYISDFFKTIKENIPSSNLTNLYRNANSLKIRFYDFKNDDFLESLRKCAFVRTGGRYHKDKNLIMVQPISMDLYIFHELLHMASSYSDNDTYYSGFSQSPIKDKTRFSVGCKLNEGYTEVLNKRYFQYDNYVESYQLECNYARAVEGIIGKEKMEELYFTANLSGLLDELAKYTSIEEASMFIRNTDFISSVYADESNTFKFFQSNFYFLIKAFINKKISENKSIFDYETKKEIIIFASKLCNRLIVEGITYELDRKEILNNYVYSLLEEEKSEIKK